MRLKDLLGIVLSNFPFFVSSTPAPQDTARKCAVRKLNGGFESGSSFPWVFDGRSVSSLSFNNDTANAQSGSYYAYIHLLESNADVLINTPAQ
jgi:hypothetical protein